MKLDTCVVADSSVCRYVTALCCSYDAVTIACSVQYLQTAEAVMQEIHRVLKPGGQVGVADGCSLSRDRTLSIASFQAASYLDNWEAHP